MGSHPIGIGLVGYFLHFPIARPDLRSLSASWRKQQGDPVSVDRWRWWWMFPKIVGFPPKWILQLCFFFCKKFTISNIHMKYQMIFQWFFSRTFFYDVADSCVLKDIPPKWPFQNSDLLILRRRFAGGCIFYERYRSLWVNAISRYVSIYIYIVWCLYIYIQCTHCMYIYIYIARAHIPWNYPSVWQIQVLPRHPSWHGERIHQSTTG